MSQRRSRGFTLIELLVVVAIVAVLVAVLMPALAAAREQTRRLVCGANLHSISQGLMAYAGDHGGNYPKRWLRKSHNQELWYLVSVVRHWETLNDERPEGTGLIRDYIGGGGTVMYCASFPYRDWPTNYRVDGPGWSNSVSYSVWSWSDWSWENDEHHSMIYKTASGTNSDPWTFIASDRVNLYHSWALTSNHPPGASMTTLDCSGGNVLYNDMSVKWKPVSQWSGPIYTRYFYPRGQ